MNQLYIPSGPSTSAACALCFTARTLNVDMRELYGSQKLNTVFIFSNIHPVIMNQILILTTAVVDDDLTLL